MDATTDRMPAIFIGHGAPPLLEDDRWMGQLRTWVSNLPRPKGILIVSAHWESAPIALSASGPAPQVIYDFGGFAQHYYTLDYPTPDATEFAALVASVFPDGRKPHQHPSRGLDHGAWVPLRVMYPDADIPVLQLSLPSSSPAALLDIGRRLQPLRDQGILIMGSGFVTHGLPYINDWTPQAKAPGWSAEFDHWTRDALAAGDLDTLMDFKDLAPGMPYAHPSTEHFSPLFVTLGAATDPGAAPTTVIDGYWFGLAKRSIEVA